MSQSTWGDPSDDEAHSMAPNTNMLVDTRREARRGAQRGAEERRGAQRNVRDVSSRARTALLPCQVVVVTVSSSRSVV